MITIIQVKAHFMKFNCFSLHSLTSVIFLHTILQSLRLTVLLCMFIDINILHDVWYGMVIFYLTYCITI